jgi:RNA polymerase sigma factor for flagellar operon FliA
MMQDERFKAALTATIDTLPEKEKLMMALYYQEDLNLKEIGEILEVSESRVSQIHSQALTRIRAKMVDWT